MLQRQERLYGVHPDLVRVVLRCATVHDFIVIEGLRTVEQERADVASGVSTTMHSRHLNGRAVDLGAIDPATGHLTWDYPHYVELAAWMKDSATIEHVPIEWGGDWHTFKDGTHFQLPWAQYP